MTPELDALVLGLVDVIETAPLDQQKRLYDALVAAKQADPSELRSAVMARMMIDGMESALRPFSIE
jgi:hypothetical protein